MLNALGHDESKAKVAAGIYLSLPGIPFVYYGEEIGMVGSGPHEVIRRPMQWADGPNAGFTTGVPWTEINDNYQNYNVLVEQQDPTSLLAWYKKLIAVRNQAPARHLFLQQNYPNPFNPSTTIRYSLPSRTHVSLRVFDVAGREVAVIQEGVQPAGTHEIRWAGLDKQDRQLSAGVYFLRLAAGGDSRVTKLVLLK